MGALAEAMDSLAQNLASSTATRLKGIEQLRVEVSEALIDTRNLLSRFHIENQEQAAQLRDRLHEFRTTLEADVEDMIESFSHNRQHRAHELRKGLAEFGTRLHNEINKQLTTFRRTHQHQAKELKTALHGFRRELETEMRTALDELRHTTLAENAADCREAHQIWMGRPTASGGFSVEPTPKGKPAEAATKAPKPTTARKRRKRK